MEGQAARERLKKNEKLNMCGWHFSSSRALIVVEKMETNAGLAINGGGEASENDYKLCCRSIDMRRNGQNRVKMREWETRKVNCVFLQKKLLWANTHREERDVLCPPLSQSPCKPGRYDRVELSSSHVHIFSSLARLRGLSCSALFSVCSSWLNSPPSFLLI